MFKCVDALYEPPAALPIFVTAAVVLGIPAHFAEVLISSFAPHQVLEVNTAPLLLEAVMTRNAKTLPLLTNDADVTALPRVVVAKGVGGIHSVWSAIEAALPAVCKLLFTEVLLVPVRVTFHPLLSLVVTARVLVARATVPGLTLPNWSVETVNVSAAWIVAVRVGVAD